jgi:ankyrin repeat protein
MPEDFRQISDSIFRAIRSGNPEIVKESIKKDWLVLGQEDSKGMTPIFLAIKLGKVDIVKAIIENIEEDPLVLKQEFRRRGMTPIFFAIRAERLKEVPDVQKKIIEAIIEKDPSVLEQKDARGMTPIFRAIASGNLEIVKAIIENIEKDSPVLEQKDAGGMTPIFRAIASGNLEIVKAIIENIEKDSPVLKQKDSNGFTPILHAIILENSDIVEAIIKKDPSVLEQKDAKGMTPIFYAITSGNLDIVKAIIENIEEDPLVLKQEFRKKGMTPIFFAIRAERLKEVPDVQKKIIEAIIEKDPSVLEQKDAKGMTPIFRAIASGNLEIVSMIIEKDPSVLKKTDPSQKTPILHAIILENSDIVEAIIKKDPSALEQEDANGLTPIFYAAIMSVKSSGRDNEDKASAVLKVILEQQFSGNINNASQEDVKELFLKKMLLKGIYSEEEALFDFKCLEKAFDKIIPENTFKEIYQDLFNNVDKNQPITSTKKEELKNEEMFIFQSKLKGHESFFIFHVNEDKNLTSISYCDGNKIDKKQKIKGSATHINGVTTFKLNTPIGYSPEFAENFIKENTKDKKKEEFYKKFIEKTIEIEGAEIDYSKTTHSIPAKAQKRGNCVFKSPSLLARFILETIDPTMKFGFDEASKKPTGAGYDEYKKFKDGLTKNALDSIITIKEKISSESDSFSEHFKKYIEDIMKMVEAHSATKLSKDGQPREGFHKKMNHLSFQAHRIKTSTPSNFPSILSNTSPEQATQPKAMPFVPI